MNNLETLTQLLLDDEITAEAFTTLSGGAPLPNNYTSGNITGNKNTVVQGDNNLTLSIDGDLSLSGNLAVGDVVEGDKQTATNGGIINNNTTINNPKPESPAEKARCIYLRRLRDHCNALPLAAMGEDQSTGERIGLDTVYIDLNTQTRVDLTPQEQEEAKSDIEVLMGERDGKTRLLSATEITTLHKRLVLLGAPGSGKSSFVRQLVANHAKQCEIDNENSPFPLFMTLRDLPPPLK